VNHTVEHLPDLLVRQIFEARDHGLEPDGPDVDGGELALLAPVVPRRRVPKELRLIQFRDDLGRHRAVVE
jgi:hypothetical protein